MLFAQVVFQQYLKQVVPVDPADIGTGALIGGDISGVFREDVAHQLVDGIVPLFLQRMIHIRQNCLDFFIAVFIDGSFKYPAMAEQQRDGGKLV